MGKSLNQKLHLCNLQVVFVNLQYLFTGFKFVVYSKVIINCNIINCFNINFFYCRLIFGLSFYLIKKDYTGLRCIRYSPNAKCFHYILRLRVQVFRHGLYHIFTFCEKFHMCAGWEAGQCDVTMPHTLGYKLWWLLWACIVGIVLSRSGVTPRV